MPVVVRETTRTLLENLPRGGAVGLDLSRIMIVHAHQNLAGDFGGRARFGCCRPGRTSFQQLR
jgi:hypothetical protein